MRVLYEDARVRLEAQGLDDGDTPTLVLRGVCRRCGALLYQRDLTWAVRTRAVATEVIQGLAWLDTDAVQQHRCAVIEREG